MTAGMDLPRIIDANLVVLEIVSYETQTTNDLDQGRIITRFKNTPLWMQAPIVDMDTVVQWLNMLCRAETVTLDALSFEDDPEQNTDGTLPLPLLWEFHIYGPHTDRLLRLASLIEQPEPTVMSVAYDLGTVYAPPHAMLVHAGLVGLGNLDLIVEAGNDRSWSTIAMEGTRRTHIWAFCNGRPFPSCSPDFASNTSFYCRKGAVSRKSLPSDANARNEYHSLLSQNVTYLLVRPLTRQHAGRETWHLESTDYRFMSNLTALRTIVIEDEHHVSSILRRVMTNCLECVIYVCQPDWEGKSGLMDLLWGRAMLTRRGNGCVHSAMAAASQTTPGLGEFSRCILKFTLSRKHNRVWIRGM